MLGRRALEGLRSRGAGGGVHGVGVVALASDLKADGDRWWVSNLWG